jgi:hypothetical protein
MRSLVLSLVLVLLVFSCACGSDWEIRGTLNTGTFAGTVSIVHLTLSNDGTQITVVTLLNQLTANDFTFCGNVVNQFPMNSTVQGTFQPGTTCGTIVKITVTG